jgi:hypothetical protein
MSETVVLVGIACLVGAIVGGGLKLAQIELPLIDSLPRQVMLATVGVVIVVVGVVGVGQQDDTAAKPDDVTPKRSRASAPVTIGAPPGYKVQRCTEWSGSASLPDDRALILAVKNLSNDDPFTYFSTVVNWSVAPGQGNWWRPLYFDAAGQEYAVTPMVVAQSAVHAVRKDDPTTWHAKHAPPTAKVVKTVYVKRRAGEGDC